MISPFNLETLMQGVSKVNLRGGVVGKVSVTVIAVSGCMAAVAWSAREALLSYAALGAIFILSMTMLWRLVNFADRNPQAALLEGAEFLLHQQLVHGTKDHPVLEIDPLDRTQPDDALVITSDAQNLLEPDEESPSPQLGRDQGHQ